MKNLYVLYCIFVFFSSFVACSDHSEKESLFGAVKVGEVSSSEVKLSDIFGSNYRIIQFKLPDNNHVLVAGKVIKRNNCFYVSSNNNIYVFDNFGNYKSVLSKKGMANDEYIELNDFDVVENNGKINILACGMKKVNIYTLKGDRWECTKTLRFEKDFLDKIKVFSGNIIVKTNGEKTLLVSDFEGNIVGQFYDVDRDNILSKIKQFEIVDGEFVYQNGSTNSCFIFNDKFEHRVSDIITSSDNILTEEKVDYLSATEPDYMTRYDKISNDYLNLFTFKTYNSRNYLIHMMGRNKRYLTVFDNNNNKTYCYHGEEKNVVDDILGAKDLGYIATFGSSDSEDSLILCCSGANLEGLSVDITTNSGVVKHVAKYDDNDFLIEFFN